MESNCTTIFFSASFTKLLLIRDYTFKIVRYAYMSMSYGDFSHTRRFTSRSLSVVADCKRAY